VAHGVFLTLLWGGSLLALALVLAGCITVNRPEILQLAPAPPPVQVITPDPDIECFPRPRLDDHCVTRL
jgi:hypothetical protein